MKADREDKARERRIDMEVVVDAYDETERAMGWYCYLDEKLAFPFRARCVRKRLISPLSEGEVVEVVRMAPDSECEREIFVMVRWQGRILGVPLAQLVGLDVDGKTKQALDDWCYWVERGYQF